MRTFTRVAMAALLALAVSACGSDDNTSSGGATTTAGGSEKPDSSAAKDDAAAAAALLDEDCQFLAGGAFLNPTPGAGTDLEASAKQLQAVADDAPAEIKEAMATVAEGFSQFAEAMKGIDLQDPTSYTDPEVAAALEKATSSLDDAKYQEASDKVSKYVADNCGGG